MTSQRQLTGFLLAPLAVVTALLAGCDKDSPAFKANPGVKPSPQTLALKLAPAAPSASQKDAACGAASFTATITNNSKEPVVVTHPAICVPPGLAHANSDTVWKGKSEILVQIKKPDGETVVFRNNYLMAGHFELPDGKIADTLQLQPGASASFKIGWFFPNAIGKWTPSKEAMEVFRQKGRYKIKILYRNMFESARTYDGKTVAPWQGELFSNETSISIIAH